MSHKIVQDFDFFAIGCPSGPNSGFATSALRFDPNNLSKKPGFFTGGTTPLSDTTAPGTTFATLSATPE